MSEIKFSKGKCGDSTVVFPGGIEANLLVRAPNLAVDGSCSGIQVGHILVRATGLVVQADAVRDTGFTGRVLIGGVGADKIYKNPGQVQNFAKHGVAIYEPTGRVLDKLTVASGTTKQKKETNMLQSVVGKAREYVKRHEDTLVTIAILLAIDHFFFEGKMRSKITEVVQRLFDKLLRTLD